MKKITFDTETTGLALFKDPRTGKGIRSSDPRQPHIVSIAWIVDEDGAPDAEPYYTLIKPDGFTIPAEAIRIHGITTERAMDEGKPMKEVVDQFIAARDAADLIIGHNLSFDMKMVKIESIRLGYDVEELKFDHKMYCTMDNSKHICKLGPYGNKWPKLTEAIKFFFNEELVGAHGALADMMATRRLYKHLTRERKAA